MLYFAKLRERDSEYITLFSRFHGKQEVKGFKTLAFIYASLSTLQKGIGNNALVIGFHEAGEASVFKWGS